MDSFVAELKTHKLKKAPKPPPKDKDRSKEPSLLGMSLFALSVSFLSDSI